MIIATHGRSGEVERLLGNLAEQSVPPAATWVVGASASDLPDGIAAFDGVTALVAPAIGLPAQRNHGIDAALADRRFDDEDPIIFFDDDFRPAADWVGNCLSFLAGHPEAHGVSGMVLADGVRTAPIAEDEAEVILGRPPEPASFSFRDAQNLYGCNMAIRARVFRACRFDERLPLHALLEDADMAGQIRLRGGRLYKVADLRGVHLGTAAGRMGGVRFGYSQIANVHYLAGKRTLPLKRAVRLVVEAVGANLRLSLDRSGRDRLRGNLLAVFDLIRGRLRPERILEQGRDLDSVRRA